MTTDVDPPDRGLGGPGIWDQMPLVPPTRTPKEVDDSKLIWSKPTLATDEAPASSKAKRARKKTRTAARPAATKRTKKHTKSKTKKAGLRKKRR